MIVSEFSHKGKYVYCCAKPVFETYPFGDKYRCVGNTKPNFNFTNYHNFIPFCIL